MYEKEIIMRIFIDADGCPVVHETIDLVQKMNIPVTVVKNYAHELQSEYAEIITVDISRDAADFYIANHLKHEDVLITQDYGLAALALSKKCRILTQNGLLITDHNIMRLLDARHVNQKMRQTKKIYTKHKKRTAEDDELFKAALLKLLKEV